jgi:hypothetical protein
MAAGIATAGSAQAQAKPVSDVRPVPPVATAAHSATVKAFKGLPGAATSGKATAALAAASAAPVFNNYLFCTGGYIYTDFTDPDGDDALLNVQVWALRRSNSTWAATWMLNTGASAHGVFFWLRGSDVLITTTDVTYYYLRAMDQTGTWSGWTVATGRADGTCALA